MAKMRLIGRPTMSHGPSLSLCLSTCLCAKHHMASPAKRLNRSTFRGGGKRGPTLVAPWNHALDESAHWRYLANTTEQSVRGGYAALVKLLSSLVRPYFLKRKRLFLDNTRTHTHNDKQTICDYRTAVVNAFRIRHS